MSHNADTKSQQYIFDEFIYPTKKQNKSKNAINIEKYWKTWKYPQKGRNLISENVAKIYCLGVFGSNSFSWSFVVDFGGFDVDFGGLSEIASKSLLD